MVVVSIVVTPQIVADCWLWIAGWSSPFCCQKTTWYVDHVNKRFVHQNGWFVHQNGSMSLVNSPKNEDLETVAKKANLYVPIVPYARVGTNRTVRPYSRMLAATIFLALSVWRMLLSPARDSSRHVTLFEISQHLTTDPILWSDGAHWSKYAIAIFKYTLSTSSY